MVQVSGVAYNKAELAPIITQCFIANTNNAGIGYADEDRIVKVNNYDSETGALSITAPFFYLNVTQDTVLTGAPVLSETDSCEQSTDAEVSEKLHTNTTTGEITPVYQIQLFDAQGVLGTPSYVDATGAAFTVTGVVGDEAVRVVTGSQLLAITDAAVSTLTVPANTAGAYGQLHIGNDVKVATGATVPTTTLTGLGIHVEQGQEIRLNSAMEVSTFSAIAVDNIAAAELYVEFYNTSEETGV